MWKANILYKIKNKPQPPAQLFFGIYSYIVGASPLVIDELFFPGPVASIMQHSPSHMEVDDSCSRVPVAPPAQGLAWPVMSCAHGRQMPLRNLASPSLPSSP